MCKSPDHRNSHSNVPHCREPNNGQVFDFFRHADCILQLLLFRFHLIQPLSDEKDTKKDQDYFFKYWVCTLVSIKKTSYIIYKNSIKVMIYSNRVAMVPIRKRFSGTCYFLFWYKTGFSSSSLYIFICLYTFMNLSPFSISVKRSSIAIDKSNFCSSKIFSLARHLLLCS